MYYERMNSYYPQVIQKIAEYQAILKSEYPEFEDSAECRDQILEDAYLLTMGEDRVEQWEKLLGIKPVEGSSVSDRRETVVARIRGQGKLNTELINIIVKTFTGGTANSWIANSTLYVEITPPHNNKQYRFENVEQEIKKKIPAHLNFMISRNYYTWGDINDNHNNWQEVLDNLGTWEDVYLFVPFA